jgi:hypothetical protein
MQQASFRRFGYAGREDVIKDPNLKASENCTLRIGKKRFAKIRII